MMKRGYQPYERDWFFFILLLSFSLVMVLGFHGVQFYSKTEAVLEERGELSEIPLRVMTFNIHYGLGIDGLQDIKRIARIIEEADVDVVGLQEVEDFSYRSSFINQTRWLAEELGFYAVYAPAFSIGPYKYGNAIMSRYPILSYQQFPVFSSREPRNFIKTQIVVQGKPITFINTHLGLSEQERVRHVKKIIGVVNDLTNPVVVVGDWNNTPDSIEVSMMREILNDNHEKAGLGEGYTFMGHCPPFRIDYIFTSPHIVVRNTETIKSKASDHLPVVSELVIPFD